MSNSPENPILDIAQAIKLAAGKADLAKDLFEMLIASLPGASEKIMQHHRAGQADLLFQEIHRLQGACRYCGVPALLNACQQAETYVKNSGLAGAEQLMSLLFAEIERLEDWAANNSWQAP